MPPVHRDEGSPRLAAVAVGRRGAVRPTPRVSVVSRMAQQAVADVQIRVEERCRELGVPDWAAPSVSLMPSYSVTEIEGFQ